MVCQKYSSTPCKGKSVLLQCFSPYRAIWRNAFKHPGRCPGLCDYWAFSPR